MTPSQQTTKEAPDDWRRLEIIDKAAECFMEKGYSATSLNEVARRLGCTKGRIYHHYATKTDLFFAVHREGMARLFDAVEPARHGEGDGLTVMRAMLRAHARAMMDHHALETVVAQGVQLHRYGSTTPSQRTELDALIAARDDFENLFKTQAEAAHADGSLGDLDISTAVKMMLGALQWSIVWYRPEADTDPATRDRLADDMVATLVEGLRRR